MGRSTPSSLLKGKQRKNPLSHHLQWTRRTDPSVLCCTASTCTSGGGSASRCVWGMTGTAQKWINPSTLSYTSSCVTMGGSVLPPLKPLIFALLFHGYRLGAKNLDGINNASIKSSCGLDCLAQHQNSWGRETI